MLEEEWGDSWLGLKVSNVAAWGHDKMVQNLGTRESWELEIGLSMRQGPSCLSSRANLGGKVTAALT